MAFHRSGLLFAALALLLCLFASSAQAGVYITSPDASTKESGTRMEISWRDDHKKPTLKNWGNLTIYLGTGSSTSQFMLQRLATDVRPNAHSAKVKIDRSVGASSSEYFIRIVGGATLNDGTHPESYSARFTLDKMTGKFNSTVEAALRGTGKGKGIAAGGSGGGAGGSGSGNSSSSSAAASAPKGTTSTTSSTATRPAASATTTTARGGARVGVETPLQAVGPLAAMMTCLALSLAAGLAVL
ncbi:hypothetical protein OC835_003241 [Tilletia horrida]|uniref:Yeast cell wall synthesis Kre9/Knh1-like N-terminal domain-containing protein n=1 Tax=Tilletia horrida TaxID=155126 RepID=A0AAN6GHM7_9BASI|nr:hypothetical protein OC835_003241 [Tilletia horrida]KAK0541250.1 hypothetical protein OC842_000083 [Tilletia horrida]KAK0557644.1 hypothetical protein OC844_005528 [Tilletia horrida]